MILIKQFHGISSHTFVESNRLSCLSDKRHEKLSNETILIAQRLSTKWADKKYEMNTCMIYQSRTIPMMIHPVCACTSERVILLGSERTCAGLDMLHITRDSSNREGRPKPGRTPLFVQVDVFDWMFVWMGLGRGDMN
mmetsp:Transcript_12037/g.22388  ORF Transcript_12037/g.22388 Transcript_12037/m.22388 type:complete len:138 (+) Transcript_12037:322-735(+)